MRIFVIFDKISHHLFLGESSIGNCGCDHSNLLIRNNLFLGTPSGHAFRSPALSLKLITLIFTRVVIVQDVNVPLSIPVPSVRVLIE